MKLLVLLSRVPYPLEKGDKLRAYHLVKRLAEKHEIFLCCLSDQRIAAEHVEHLQGFCQHIEVIDLERWRILLQLVRAFFSRMPYQVAYFHHDKARRRIDAAIDRFKPDHVLCQLVRTTEYVRDRHTLPKTLDFMDTLSKGMERRTENAPFYLKPLFQAETRRLIAYENLMFDLFDHNIIISAQDRDYLYHPLRDQVSVIPNGVDTDHFKPMTCEVTHDLVFTGNMNYPPNIDSVLFLVKRVLPLVRKSLPSTTLLISGVDPGQRIRQLAEQDPLITVSGWVRDIRGSYASARIFAAPMQIGTGLQNKLLEAMAMRIPCITSELANNAVGALAGESILIGNEPEEYAQHIVHLLGDAAERDRIAVNGYRFVRDRFDWAASAGTLDRLDQHSVPAGTPETTGSWSPPTGPKPFTFAAEMDIKLDRIEDAIADIRAGKVVIVVDDEDRENEGDFLTAARNATPEVVNFMATHGRGLICAPLTEERCAELGLDLMVRDNTAVYETSFTVSVDLKGHGTSTGISASDRSKTLLSLIDPATRPDDLGRPGHIFPLKARNGGVLRRTGHTEAAIDLSRLAGLEPAGVIVEILNEDGSMARLPQLRTIADRFGLKLVSIEDLVAYRMRTESLIERQVEVKLPTEFGDFQLIAYRQINTNEEHLALVKGTFTKDDAVLVRVHSSCVTGDIFGSHRCDCGPQLHSAMSAIEKEGRGVVLYMQQEGRGIGLINKLKAYKLQEEGHDTVEANKLLGFDSDVRDYGVGAQILHDLGVRRMRLLTNNPRKRTGLVGYGLEIVENVPLEIEANEHNRAYLLTKKLKMGHHLTLGGTDR